jgi:hypothetical protein
MITETRYESAAERKAHIRDQQAAGLRMVHDDLDTDWQRGEEPRGLLTWDSQPPVDAPPGRDVWAEQVMAERD